MLDASNRANNWANQRREAIDKAQRIRDERKNNLAMAGEMSMANQMGRITSSEHQYRGDFQKPMQNDYLGYKKPATMKYGMSLLDQAPSDEDLMQARSSLRLLKSKMKESNGFSNQPNQGFQKQRGYFEEETHEYMQNAPGERRLGQDNNFNDVYQNGNQNYRKVFKPTFATDNYSQQASQLNSQLNQIDQSLARKGKVLQHANTSGANDSYQPSMYGGAQSRPRPMGNQNGYNNNGYSQPPQNDDYSDFSSKNLPSRIPKNTLNSTKEYGGAQQQQQQPSRLLKNYNDPVSPMYNDNYGGGAKGWNDNSPTYDYKQPTKLPNSIPKNTIPESSLPRGNMANKNWQKEKNVQFDEPEDTQTFSKPNFKKNTQPPKSQKPPTKNPAMDGDDNRPVGTSNNNNEEPAPYAETGPQRECPMGCGRSFNLDVLDKHAKVCQKVFQTKRKKFDSSKQRELDELAEIERESRYNNPYPSKNKGKAPARPGPGGNAKGGNKAKWKAESEAFRANLKAARGAPLSKEEQQSVAQASEANLVPCPHCGRKFNDNAAQRHISFCATKSKVDNIKKGPIKGRRY